MVITSVQDAFATLQTRIAQVRDATDWSSLLRAKALFPRYSLQNAVLIAVQRPSATTVASRTAWKRLGRQIKVGETPVGVLAPAGSYPAKNTSGRGSDRNFARYRVAFAYDVEQTEGRALPAFPIDYELQGDDAAEVDAFCAIKQAALSLVVNGRRVCRRFVHRPPSRRDREVCGFFAPAERMIVVIDSVSPAAQVATAVHELAHAVLFAVAKKTPAKTHSLGHAAHEIVAESVAYLVCHTLGVETGPRSFGYIALHFERAARRGESVTGATLARLVERVVRTIMTAPALRTSRTHFNRHKILVRSGQTPKSPTGSMCVTRSTDKHGRSPCPMPRQMRAFCGSDGQVVLRVDQAANSDGRRR